jgi:hypothetical protein
MPIKDRRRHELRSRPIAATVARSHDAARTASDAPAATRDRTNARRPNSQAADRGLHQSLIARSISEHAKQSACFGELRGCLLAYAGVVRVRIHGAARVGVLQRERHDRQRRGRAGEKSRALGQSCCPGSTALIDDQHVWFRVARGRVGYASVAGTGRRSHARMIASGDS